MLQRIQSIYMAIAAALGVAQAALPVPFGIDNGTTPIDFNDNYALLVIVLASAAIMAINIFLFRNRKLQISLCKIALLAVIAGLATAIYLLVGDGTTGDMPQIGMIFPFLVATAILLARRGVQHDENLVRSADRLR